ncbi:hypothetical protein CRE_09755 [Caenorhabditis remanei]|uniref:Uncharacterized protein n=1 Tax=Caenorhabditis remanei TaxID=31234 RepID=E3N9X3_CAERE|nr:hypothetical protein CRE_09755 [Caenorhabditis remanei]
MSRPSSGKNLAEKVWVKVHHYENGYQRSIPSHLTPVCYQHRCWCVTEIAPLYIPLPYDPRTTTTTTTTTEKPIIEEGSGQAEFPEETPKKTNILDFFSIFLPNAGDIDF